MKETGEGGSQFRRRDRYSGILGKKYNPSRDISSNRDPSFFAVVSIGYLYAYNLLSRQDAKAGFICCTERRKNKKERGINDAGCCDGWGGG